MAITLRTQKGSELTFEELDGNFTDLNGRVTTLESGGGGGGIALTDLSVTTNSASGSGTLTYSNATGVFAYTPPDLSSFATSALENVVEDTTPELGGDLVTGTNRLKFSSAGGSMLDFTVTQYSVANNTVLSSVGSINLFLDSASADSSGDTAFRIFDTTDPDGTVTEANNIFKIADTGDISVKGKLLLPDGGASSNYAAFGDDDDLRIFHNGGHSIIRETGTGNLYLQSDNNVILGSDSNSETYVKGIYNNAVELYYDNVKKLETSADGVAVTGEILYSNVYSQLADLPDATTYHGMFAHVHATGKAYYAHAGNWIELANQADISGGGGGGASVTVQDDAPTSPTQGDLWWESDVGILKIYYSGAWVDASPSGSGSGGATNMASLTDVDSVDTVASGDFLLYDGSSSEYKFVAFEAEVNGLIDNRTGSSGHISTQSQYAGTITTDAADPTDAAHHVLSNTGTPSVQGASTAWYYGDVVSDPANPTTSVVLDIDNALLTADVLGNITSSGVSTFSGTVDFTNATSIDFTGATVSGLSGTTWATLGDTDGANGPTSIVLGRNAIAQGPYGFALGNGALSDAYGMAFGMETQAAGYGVQIGAFSGKNHVATNSIYSVGIGSFTHQNANPGDETGSGAIALGSYAGDANQGGMAVALGYMAGRNNQAANSIVLNATGIELENLTPNSFVVKPIRQQSQAQALFYDPASGEVTYDAAPGGGGGSGLQSRGTVTGTTGSLADAAEADLDITGFKSYALLSITTDRAARVRLYVTDATRTADASRAEGVDPTSDAGLIAEVITTGADTVIISPGAFGFNLEGTPTTTIPCRVTNKSGGASTVQVDLNILQLEA